MSRGLYKNLIVWQKSIELVKDIYILSESLPKSEEYNLKQQLKRAVISVSLNIAEGKTKRTSKNFAYFLNSKKLKSSSINKDFIKPLLKFKLKHSLSSFSLFG